MFEDYPLIIAEDEVLFPPDPLWQGRYPYANFIFFDDPAPLDPELDAWLSDGEPPVFIGFGSMSGEGTDRVERMIVEAVSATGKISSQVRQAFKARKRRSTSRREL